MQVSNSTLQRFDLTSLSAEHQARIAKFEQITGREIEAYKDEESGIVNFWHPKSTAQANFFVEFLRIGFNSPDGHMAAVENLAKLYAEIREQLMERYKDNKDMLYKRMSELNQAFEAALQSTALMPLPMISETSFFINSNGSASLNNDVKQSALNHENMKNIIRHIQNSLNRGMDIFFENFILEIGSGDFRSAFDISMETAKSGESRSLENMSFADAVRMRDTVSRWEEAEEEHSGRIIGRQQNLNISFWIISRDESISGVLRRQIADLLWINRPPAEAIATENHDNNKSELIQKSYFMGIWTLVYSCGKVEYILEEDLEDNPELRRKVNEPVSTTGISLGTPRTGAAMTSASASMAGGIGSGL